MRDQKRIKRKGNLKVQSLFEEAKICATSKSDQSKRGQFSFSKRRQDLGVDVNFFDVCDEASNFVSSTWYNRNLSSTLSVVCCEGKSDVLSRNDSWGMLRRAKLYLSRRKLVDCFSVDEFDLRRDWNKQRCSVSSLLDLFPSLKYSYSSLLPRTVVSRRRGLDVSQVDNSFVDVVVTSRSDGRHVVRVKDISRSHSIRFDPVDAPKELYRYRLRIQEYLCWARQVDVVPVMMTLTVFHRWHPLKGLVSVLKKAWNYFFTGTRAATRRAEKMGLCGYIRRMEETLNRGKGYNSGWHPHYHVLLFVSRDKLDVLSSMESELREAWCGAVLRYFESEFGESIPASYVRSFCEHGLWLSRYSVDSVASSLAPLRIVDDGSYMAKIMGCDSLSVYGGDMELSSVTQKDSFIPFDLLCEDTAENNDLWVEYVLAMKGELNFYFSQKLTRMVREYYVAHPEKVFSRACSESVVACMSFPAYRFFYDICGLREFFSHALADYASFLSWCRDKYRELGFDNLADDVSFLPMRPNLSG